MENSGTIAANGKRRKRTTITDVARSLDLTKGTVSRALNGYTDISESTRLRVKKRAREMGYTPLSHAQAIRTGFAKSLGLVLQVNEHDSHRPFLAGFLAGITGETATEGWTLTVATATTDSEMLSTLARLSRERKVDGFILPRTLTDDPRVGFLRDEGMPFVLYGRTPNPQGCAWFDILGECAMERAVSRLHRLGHSRIAFVNGGPQYYYSKLRLEGYRAGLKTAGIDFDEKLIRDGGVSIRSGAEASEDLLTLPRPPTALIFAMDMAAFGLYRVADSYGLKIGSDLSVVSYDGITESAHTNPQLTTFSVNRTHAGKRLARILIDRIRGLPLEQLRKTEHAELLEGGSDGPPALTCEELALRVESVRRKELIRKGE